MSPSLSVALTTAPTLLPAAEFSATERVVDAPSSKAGAALVGAADVVPSPEADQLQSGTSVVFASWSHSSFIATTCTW